MSSPTITPWSHPRGAPLVDHVARALVAAPSLGPVTKAWGKLGFEVSKPFEFLGCRAVDILLEGSAVRFVAQMEHRHPTPLASLVADRLIEGAGLLGWTWFCAKLPRSLESIERASGGRVLYNLDGSKSVVLPRELTPGAVTVLEPLVKEWVPQHRNQISYLDRLVLMASDVEKAAQAYIDGFGLELIRQTTGERRSMVLAADHSGGPLIEIVGPDRPSAEPLTAHLWGLTFESPDLDRTVACMRGRGIAVADPQRAGDRGRGVTLPTQIGGIQIAIFGR